MLPFGRLLRHLPAALGLLLFGGAIYVVQREFHDLKVADIQAALADLPPRALALSFLWNLLAYGILTFYDRLGTEYAGHRVSFGKVAFASFAAYTLAHNLGFAAVSGAAVRYRLYAHWGLTPLQIGKVIVFCSLTFGFGALVLAGGILVFEPDAIPFIGSHVPAWMIRAVGIAMWLAVTAYATLSRVLGTVRLFGNSIELPGLRMALAQITLATVDVGVTAAIMYALLPDAPGLTYPRFLGIYLASYSAGLLATVPGGLGVFDTAMLLGLSPYMEAPRAVSAILVFRLYYYIIPLFLAGGLFAGNEILLRGRGALGQTSGVQAIGRWSQPDFAVAAATGAVALCAALMMSVGLLEDIGAGWERSDFWIVGTMSAFIPSLLGAALLVLAAALAQRVKFTWRATIALLLAGALFTALEGGGRWIPLTLLATAGVLAPFGRAFYRDASLFAGRLRAGTATPLVLLVLCLAVLAFLAPKLRWLERASWWEIIAASDVPTSLRATLALFLALGLLALWRLLRPAEPVATPWDDAARVRLAALGARETSGAEAVIWGEAGRAALLVRRLDGVLLALGDPIGDRDDQVSAVWRLRDLARQERRSPAIWRAGRALLPIYGDIGLAALPLGPDLLPTTEDEGTQAAPAYLACDPERDLDRLMAELPRLPR